ncbi:MAG: GntR family transcriptional regulator [Candidatus Methylomirabilales bacterium]
MPQPPAPVPVLSPPAASPLRIEHENLDLKICQRLRQMIVARELRPGQRLLQEHLARELGVSRTPLVNALKRLAQEGLVEWVSRRGIYVKRFTKREMARLFEVREALEALAARRAAERMPRGEAERLWALFRGLGGRPTAARVRRYVERDRYLHWRLVELAANEPLARALDSVNMRFFAYQDGLVRPPAETLPEHRAILRALGRGDAAAAEAAMRLHIRRSVEKLEREAEDEEGGAGSPAAPACTRAARGRRPSRVAGAGGRRRSAEGR